METKSIGSASSLISCFEIRLHPLLIEVSVLIKLTKDKLFAFTFAKVAFFLLLLRSVDCSNGEGTHAGQLTYPVWLWQIRTMGIIWMDLCNF